MSGVKREKVFVPHPDGDEFVVERTRISVDTSDTSAEAAEAITRILDSCAHGGKERIAAFEKAVRAETVKLAKTTIDLRESQHKPRGSRMPQLDEWIDAKLAADSEASNVELWSALPHSDAGGNKLFRAGLTVCEVANDDRERSIGRPGFDKRVTAARQRQKNDVSK